MNITKEFIENLRKDMVLIHPTDTIPGVTYLPSSDRAFTNLCEVKDRDMSKTCIALVNSFDMASRFFDKLSSKDMNLLKKYWPAPLSVVAKASKEVPETLVRDDGTISLRFPKAFPLTTCGCIKL